MKARIIQIAIAIGLISLMTFLFIKTNVVSSDAHNRFSQHLHHLIELDATMDRDVLESRYGQLTTYDSLKSEADELRFLQNELKDAPDFLAPEEREKIGKFLKDFRGLEEQKQQLIEQFKSRNAILNNSVRYFPVAASDLLAHVDLRKRKELGPVDDLLRDTLSFYLLSNEDLQPTITKRIDDLQRFDRNDASVDLQFLITHAQTIVKLKPEVDDLVKQIAAIPTSDTVEGLIRFYDTSYDGSLQRAETYRLLLYILSVVLLAYIGFIIFKLRKAKTDLDLVNDSLEQRVHERTEALSLSNADLQKSEEKFRDLFDNAPVAYHELDINGCFMRVNRTEEKILGYSEAELMARHVAEIIVEPEARAWVTAQLSGTVPTSAIERTFICKDGSRVSVLKEDRVIHDNNGTITGVRSILQDITERKILEDKVQRGQKLESIGQLAAGIAHEINTPTQYVGDNVRFLKDGFQDLMTVFEKTEHMVELCKSTGVLTDFTPEMERAIADADVHFLMEEIPRAFVQSLDGIERIRKIVQSMKDFAHPGSTDMKFTDLNKAIESTLTVASNEWKYIANVVTNYDATLPNIPCLAGEFNQVILNMIVNAAHAISDTIAEGSNEKGTINISTSRNGDFAEIRISDSGTGIPEEIRKKIFDPFFTTKEVGKGTGQGLAISHTVIVEKHKGTISVESEAGKGTTFVICLPVHEITPTS